VIARWLLQNSLRQEPAQLKNVTELPISFTPKRSKEPPKTIEIHNPELESILQQQLKAGNFAGLEDMLLPIFRGAQFPADEQRKAKAFEAAARIRELPKGVTLERPEGVSLREYAHIGYRN
jgi:hypothetical protein